MPILGTIASSTRQGQSTDAGAMFPITTFTVASATSTLSFSNIPSTYRHLQIRGVALSSTTPRLNIRFNGDTGSNYAVYVLEGNGSTPFRQADVNLTSAYVFINGFYTANQPQPFVIDILDYKSTTNFKTLRALTGGHNNSGGNVALNGAIWRNASTAISSITLLTNGGTFSEFSSFALYGIKG